MNSTEPEGQTDGHSEGDGELKDGDDWSEEENHVFTGGLRRSKRQVSFQTLPGAPHMRRSSRRHSEGNVRAEICIFYRDQMPNFHTCADSLTQLPCE